MNSNNKMRILMLNYEFPPLGGGASPASYEIAKGYVKLGHSVDVVTMHYKGLPFFEVKDGINIYRVKCLRKKKEICTTLEMLTYIISAKHFLKKHLKTNKYNINHTHFIIPTGIVALWAKKKFGIPYIITSHGSDVPGYNSDRFKLMHKFTKSIIRKVCIGAKIITAPSKSHINLIKAQIGKYPFAVIPYPMKDFLIKSLKKENIIISSGRLLPRKGFQYLIKAFESANLEGWKLYIIGDGPYKNELKSMAKNNPEIIFTGWLDNSSKKYKELFNKSKIFSLLSSKETLGVVFQEAMSTKCAIISSNLSGCPETVGNTGSLVKPSDVSKVKEKLTYLVKNPKILKRYAKDARKRYENVFSLKTVIPKYEDLIK
ncbi:MAG: glycosyltransferase family 4 protein [Nanoarchaeota archaeon]